MATSFTVADFQDEAMCPICKQLLTDPLLLDCGHNFCRLCISEYYLQWKEHSGPLKCPVCQAHIVGGRLRANEQLGSLVEKLKQIPLVDKGRDYVCLKHKEKLNLFCANDEELLCVVCERSPEHRSHKVVLAEEAVQEYKAKILRRIRTLKEKKSKIESHPMDAEKETLDLLKRIQTEKDKMVTDFQKLHAFLDEQESYLLDLIKELQTEVTKKRKAHLKKLEDNISALNSIIQEIQESCEQPAVDFLWDYQSNIEKSIKAVEDPECFPLDLKWKVCDVVDINLLLENIAEQCKETLISGLPLHKAQVTLEPATAHPQLILSDDCKIICMSGYYRSVRKSPERFDEWPFVLGRDGFVAGRHYWEVAVEREGTWGVGVAKKSVKRHGDVNFSPEQGFWAVGKWDGSYTAYNPPYYTLLTLYEELKRIRIFLNIDGGWVTFYDANTATPVFAYSVGSFFGETIFPFFYVFGKARLRLCS